MKGILRVEGEVNTLVNKFGSKVLKASAYHMTRLKIKFNSTEELKSEIGRILDEHEDIDWVKNRFTISLSPRREQKCS